jgi:Glycosyl hydrolase family 10/Bacterial Ig domain
VKHYKGRITEWDVLNEGINIGDGHPNGLRKSFWLNILGDSYIDSAFVWAHQADPSAYLYFNEFGAEGNGSWDKAKSDSVYSLVKRLLDRGIPVHGVGFQGHFNDYVNTASISANIKRLGDLGLRVSITEIDMMNTSSKPTPWVNLMKACLDNKNCTSFVVWGVDDLHSWMGKDCACLLWDTLFKPKNLLYNGLITAINTANPSISADRKAFSNQPAYTPTPKPIVSNLSYCQGDLTKALTATGTSIKWYKSSQDSVSIPSPIPTSSVAETQLYYVTQTQNWLESEKAELKVTINSLPVLTQNTRTDTKGWTQTTTFNVCSGENIFTGPWPNVSNVWTWKGPNGFSASIRNPILSNINKTQEGIYTATYTDVKGCRNNINLNIVVSVPSITITSPANNAASTTDLVPINTTVSGTNMSNVTFYNGTNILGTKTTSPYSFTTPSLANGTYTLSAIAKNTFGCTDTAKVEVTVNKIITLNQQGGFEYSISTISGKILEHGNAFDHVIVGNNLPIGIYLINIKSSNKNITYRIIKQ